MRELAVGVAEESMVGWEMEMEMEMVGRGEKERLGIILSHIIPPILEVQEIFFLDYFSIFYY